MTIKWTIVVALVAAAAAWDLRTRRVPNVLTLPMALAGVVYAAVQGGGDGLLRSVAGAAVGLAVFLPLFALRGLGGGDVKLMAALGAWLGPALTLWAAVCASLAGGVAALATALAHGYLSQALTNIAAMCGIWRSAGLVPIDGLTLRDSRSPRLPYALPIAAGTLVAVWLRG